MVVSERSVNGCPHPLETAKESIFQDRQFCPNSKMLNHAMPNQDAVLTKASNPMTTKENLTQNESAINQLLAQVAKQAEENARLKAEMATQALELQKGKRGRILKVSEKGAVTFNDEGIRRFGVTLYPDEWEVIFGAIEDVKKFIHEPRNRAKMSFKADLK